MARPKQKERRDRQFNVSLTSDELALLRARASACGMHPVDYGRARLLDERRVPTRGAGGRTGLRTEGPHLDPLYLAQLSRIGNNLNQLTRLLNGLRKPPPPTLEPLLQQIRELIARGVGP